MRTCGGDGAGGDGGGGTGRSAQNVITVGGGDGSGGGGGGRGRSVQNVMSQCRAVIYSSPPLPDGSADCHQHGDAKQRHIGL